MKIVFFGTGDYAVPALKALLSSDHRVAAVVTRPDRGKDRKGNKMSSPVKSAVIACSDPDIMLHQPEEPNGKAFISLLEGIAPDVVVVSDYGCMLSSEMLEVPGRYCVNLHASLLPRWRGASPVNRAIIEGDHVTGNTVIKMTRRMDAGPILLRRETEVRGHEYADQLQRRLAEEGARLLIEAVELIDEGSEKFYPQQEDKATYAPKLNKREGLIDWSEPSDVILRKIRGLNPRPGTYTFLNGKRLNIRRAVKAEAFKKEEPGKLETTGGFVVFCGEGSLEVEEIQMEGRKSMPAEAFLRGRRMNENTVLGK